MAGWCRRERPLIIGWDRVRGLGGDQKAEWGKYAEVADKAWRARTRLERGDFIAGGTNP
jgi:hypothetical protein